MQVYHKLKDFTKKYPRMAVALGMSVAGQQHGVIQCLSHRGI